MDSELLYKDCLNKQKIIIGEHTPDYLGTLHNLALCIENQKRYTEAEKLYEICWEKRKASLGPDNPSTLCTMNNLGWQIRHYHYHFIIIIIIIIIRGCLRSSR